MQITATNLEVGEYKNIGEGTYVAPSLNFMFVPSSRNKHAVAKCCAQLGRVVERLGSGKRGGPCRKCFPFFAAFCDSRKTLEKMAQPSHPCVKPGLHNRQIFFLSFPSSRLGCLALARAPKPVWPPDDTACPLAGVFVINVYVLKVSFAAIFVSWMKVGSAIKHFILLTGLPVTSPVHKILWICSLERG